MNHEHVHSMHMKRKVMVSIIMYKILYGRRAGSLNSRMKFRERIRLQHMAHKFATCRSLLLSLAISWNCIFEIIFFRYFLPNNNFAFGLSH